MKKNISELFGTFCLTLFGCGAAAIAGGTVGAVSGLGLLGISLAFGLAVVVMAYTIGPISGCHINPAISIGMLAAGKLSVKDTVGYVIGQSIGAVLAILVLSTLLNGQSGFVAGEWAYGSNGWGEGYLGNYSMQAAFIAELVFTAIFLIVIHAVTSKLGNVTMAGLAIGLTLVLIHMVAIPITGTSVNPARSLGPAIFAGGMALQQLWLFIVAPIVGAIIGTLAWKYAIATENN
ncbi:MIP family channel protein [Pontimicrobium aquaticum]|uniref:MIP family channel protein n=1 Tax=Pontimicrobium aquaticum TaxID=2565367 RepID=A0A4U0F0S2_9FLAO|nr:MIP family channel protein [Pontimicrobium aquaticum]TJY37324.1 MIP family channel protein [Pontimicrobium aquaticum]